MLLAVAVPMVMGSYGYICHHVSDIKNRLIITSSGLSHCRRWIRSCIHLFIFVSPKFRRDYSRSDSWLISWWPFSKKPWLFLCSIRNCFEFWTIPIAIPWASDHISDLKTWASTSNTKPCWNYSPAEVIWVCPEPSVIPFWWLAERASHGGFCISHSLSNKWYRTTPTHCESAIIQFLEARILTFEAHHLSSL